MIRKLTTHTAHHAARPVLPSSPSATVCGRSVTRDHVTALSERETRAGQEWYARAMAHTEALAINGRRDAFPFRVGERVGIIALSVLPSSPSAARVDDRECDLGIVRPSSGAMPATRVPEVMSGWCDYCTRYRRPCGRHES